MNKAPVDASLWSLIANGHDLSTRYLHGAGHRVALSELVQGSSVDCGRAALSGASVLVATADQLTTGLALIELDGIARRLVVSPPDVTDAHLAHVIETARIDAVVSDGAVGRAALPHSVRLVTCSPVVASAPPPAAPSCASEWVLLTSGTTGVPKLVAHTLASLVGAIQPHSDTPTDRGVWSTFYDIRRYGGMQIFFRGVIGGGSLVLSSAGETTADFLARAGHRGVTYISGTPSHWRRALMSSAADRIAPKYVRLSGEIADQAILNDLKKFYRNAVVSHAFATTEAGVAFTVNDGRAGFPAALIGQHGEVEIKIEDGSMRIRSPRTASCYLGAAGPALRDPDGFVDTGDIIETRDDRCYFMGRRGGIINVGGLKVYPEEIEAVINRHPAVQMSLVKARKSPFTGAVVVAEVVVRPGSNGEATISTLQGDILAACRRDLAPHKVPATIRFVDTLDVGSAGKLVRLDA